MQQIMHAPALPAQIPRKLGALLSTLLLLCTLAFVVPQTACTPKTTVISAIQSVITGLGDALSEAQKLDPAIGSAIVAKIQSGLTIAGELLSAAQSATGNTAHFLASLIPVVDQILPLLSAVIPAPAMAGIMAGLSIVNFALNFLSNSLLGASSAVKAKLTARAASSDMDTIRAFAARPVWGRRPAPAK